MLLIWIHAILFSGGLTHPVFVIPAWIIIFQAQQDRRHREALRAGRPRDED